MKVTFSKSDYIVITSKLIEAGLTPTEKLNKTIQRMIATAFNEQLDQEADCMVEWVAEQIESTK